MKKVGILNFQYSTHNYGAVLQAAALEYICRQLGYDAEHLDYMAKPKMSFIRLVGGVVRKLGLRKKVANEEAFELFRQDFITRTQRIKTSSEFLAVASSFDAVIVGSDQVWRPAFAKDTIGFFLGHVPKGVDRVAYAASFGTVTWEALNDTALTMRVKEELQQFKAISCREASGVDICRDVFGVKAVHVLDPLLLVDDSFFEKVTAKTIVQTNAKLIYYKLDSSQEFKEDLKAVSDKIGANGVNIYSSNNLIREYREVVDWLGMICNSEVVLTDSFHCICLALRFGKEVIYCPNERRGKTRLDSLFKVLQIDIEPLAIELKTPMFKLVSRGNIGAILEHERVHAIKFLKDALDA